MPVEISVVFVSCPATTTMLYRSLRGSIDILAHSAEETRPTYTTVLSLPDLDPLDSNNASANVQLEDETTNLD